MKALAEIEALIKQGDQAWRQESAQDALEIWLEALKLVDQVEGCKQDAAGDLYCRLWLRVGKLKLVQGRMDAACDAFEKLAHWAAKLDLVEWQAVSKIWLGRAARQRGDKNAAESAIQEAQRLAGELSPGIARKRTLAMVYYEQGRLALQSGDSHSALSALRVAQTLYQKVNDSIGEATALTSIGGLYLYLGFSEQAVIHYGEAANRYDQASSDPTDVLLLQSGWGVACMLREQYQQALSHYHKALSIAQRLGAEPSAARCLNNIAVVLTKLGDCDKAMVFYQQVVELFRNLQNRQGLAAALCNMGDIYVLQGEAEQALTVLNLARDLAEEINFRPLLPEVYVVLSSAYLLAEQPLAAFDNAEQALHLAEELGNMEYAAMAYRALGQAAIVLEKIECLPSVAPADGPKAYFDASLEILERSEPVYERARTLNALGSYLSASSEPAEHVKGEACCAQAMAYFVSIGCQSRQRFEDDGYTAT